MRAFYRGMLPSGGTERAQQDGARWLRAHPGALQSVLLGPECTPKGRAAGCDVCGRLQTESSVRGLSLLTLVSELSKEQGPAGTALQGPPASRGRSAAAPSPRCQSLRRSLGERSSWTQANVAWMCLLVGVEESAKLSCISVQERLSS